MESTEAALEPLLCKNQCSAWGASEACPRFTPGAAAYKGMRSLPLRCMKTLQPPPATSFFISNYGSAFNNRASAPLGVHAQHRRPLRVPPPSVVYSESFSPYANMLTKLTGFRSASEPRATLPSPGRQHPFNQCGTPDYLPQIRFALSTFIGSSFLFFCFSPSI